MKEMKLLPGENISDACANLAKQAPAWMNFNDTRVEAKPGDTAGDIYQRWDAERTRKQEEYRASPEYKKQQEEAAKHRAEEERVRTETIAFVTASGVRDRYRWAPTMGEISGFGGGYEEACRDMLYAGLAWLKAHPTADVKKHDSPDAEAMGKFMLAACPDCSGAMYGATTNAVGFIAALGWEEYVARMTKRTAGPTAP